MNRRNFFKVVTGFVTGIFVGSTKAKPQLTVAMLQKVKKELDGMEPTAIWHTWSSVDGVTMCKLEKGKWHSVVIRVADFDNNQSITIV